MWNIPASDSALKTGSGSWRMRSISSLASATSGFSARARSIGFGSSLRFCCITELHTRGRSLSIDRSIRSVTRDLHPAHDAAKWTGVVDRDVLDAAIVPERHRAGLPAEAAGKLRPMAVLEQIVEQRLALRLGHVLEADRVGR